MEREKLKQEQAKQVKQHKQRPHNYEPNDRLEVESSKSDQAYVER